MRSDTDDNPKPPPPYSSDGSIVLNPQYDDKELLRRHIHPQRGTSRPVVDVIDAMVRAGVVTIAPGVLEIQQVVAVGWVEHIHRFGTIGIDHDYYPHSQQQ